MVFKDLKANYPVYILDKVNFTVSKATVRETSFPRMTTNPNTGKSGMVVDTVIQIGNSSNTYALPESSSVTYTNDSKLVISIDQQGLIGELESLKSYSEKCLKEVPYHEEALKKIPILLSELSPIYKEKVETENRFNQIEGSISDMGGILKTQSEALSKILNHLNIK